MCTPKKIIANLNAVLFYYLKFCLIKQLYLY